MNFKECTLKTKHWKVKQQEGKSNFNFLGKKITTIEISSSLTEKKNQMIQEWSSYKGRKENALALGADEGRSNLR